MPPWNGRRLAAAFAARRDQAWTLGYASMEASTVAGHAAWEGTFPCELTGTLMRNGPARHERGGQRYAHRWDGDGMVQRFSLNVEGVAHLGRFVQTRKLLDEDAVGHMLYSGFGTPIDPEQPTLERIENSNPARPDSVAVGISGSSSERTAPRVAMARRRPSLINGSDGAIDTSIIGTSPAATPIIAGVAPL